MMIAKLLPATVVPLAVRICTSQAKQPHQRSHGLNNNAEERPWKEDCSYGGVWVELIKDPVTLHESEPEEVKALMHLGSIVGKQGGTGSEVRARIGKMRAAHLPTEERLEPHSGTNPHKDVCKQ